MEKGQVKITAFQRNGDKLNKIAYLLTPEGLHRRMAMTRAYLDRKTMEYQALQSELAELRADLEGEGANG